MQIVLIRWCVRADREQEFLDYWRDELPVRDKSGLIAESLSRVGGLDERFNWDTTTDDTPAGAVIYINVGLWRDNQAYRDAIPAPWDALRPFEAGPRLRARLEPRESRLGALALADQLLPTLID